MLDKINCCVLALVAFAGNIIQLVFFFNYSLKLKDRSLQLEKQEIKNNERIKELETDLSVVKAFNKDLQKKNGHEQNQLTEQQKEISQLKEKIKQLEQNLNHALHNKK